MARAARPAGPAVRRPGGDRPDRRRRAVGRQPCATRCATCCARASTAAAGWTGWPSGSGRCAPQARRRGDLGGTLDQVRAALDQALAAERETLAGSRRRRRPVRRDGAGHAARRRRRGGPGAGRLRLALRRGPGDLSRRSRTCCGARCWTPSSPGMKQALESPDAEAMQRVKDMLADLNALLAAHARQEDTTDQFADFMAKHGEFFPEQPENDRGADRRAGPPAGGGPADAGLAQPGAARAARPADEPGAGRCRPGLGDGAAGGQPARPAAGSGPRVRRRDAAGRGVARLQRGRRRRWPSSPTWRRCRRSSPRADAGSTLDDVDVDMLEQRLGPEAVRDFAGAAGSGTRAGAAGLPDPWRRRAAAHPARRPPARPDGAAPGLRPARRVRAR